VSPLFFYYVIEGLIAGGAESYAYRYVNERYAPALAISDFATLRESWIEEGKRPCNSSIHGGGAGVAWTLTRNVLGIEPESTGFRSCRIAPKPGDLRWARGTLPSPCGEIRVAWLDAATAKSSDLRSAPPPADLFSAGEPDRSTSPDPPAGSRLRFKLEAVLPDDVPAVLVVPISGGTLTRVFHNGRPVDVGASHAAIRPAPSSAKRPTTDTDEQSAKKFVLRVPGGRHRICAYVR
jgi:hypothetical protein